MVPRKGLIAIGLVLMAINRVAGLVLPFMSKPLLDKVLSTQHPHPELLSRIIFIVFGAMAVQAITSYALTQSLSKAGQRLIAELRRQVQRHVLIAAHGHGNPALGIRRVRFRQPFLGDHQDTARLRQPRRCP